MREYPEGFHWKDGWYFKRETDGSVHITKFDFNRAGTPAAEAIIDPESWASIVASVSFSGETSLTWQYAKDFHQRTLTGHVG